MNGLTPRLHPRTLDRRELRTYMRHHRRKRAFKEAVTRALSTTCQPGWRERLRQRADAGKVDFFEWLAWSLIFTGAGDLPLFGDPLVDRPPDPRAIRLLGEFSKELATRTESGGGTTIAFVLAGPSLPLPPPPESDEGEQADQA